MGQYLHVLTEDSTLLGMTFQNWMPLVAVFMIVWVGALTSKL
jgi:hypothetical protein